MEKRIPIAALIFILFYFSCKKDNTVGTPTAQVISPAAMSTFVVNDTITIKAQVSDGVSLQSVSVYITNNQNIPVLPSLSIPITGKNMTFTCPYPLNNIHLASGLYTIVVKAFNGTNTGWGFQQINITALPSKLTGIYTVTRNHTGVHIVKADTNYNVSTVYTQGGDYSSSDISTYYQQLYIAAADSGNATAISLPNTSVAWSYLGITSSTTYFTNTYSYNDAVYVSQYNGQIKYYSHLGAGVMSITVTAGNYPIKTYVWSSYLFAEEKNIGSQTRNLVLYYAPSGAGFEQNTLPGPVVNMLGMDVNDLFVFGNQNTGGAYMELYNIPGNIFYSPIALPSGNLLSVAQVNPQTYLLGFDNGTIYLYTYNPNSIIPFINGVVASHMQYDAVGNLLFVSSGKYVYGYNYTTAGLLHTCNIQDSVLNLHLLYNK